MNELFNKFIEKWPFTVIFTKLPASSYGLKRVGSLFMVIILMLSKPSFKFHPSHTSTFKTPGLVSQDTQLTQVYVLSTFKRTTFDVNTIQYNMNTQALQAFFINYQANMWQTAEGGPTLEESLTSWYLSPQVRRWRTLRSPSLWASWPLCSSVSWPTLLCLLRSPWWCHTTCSVRRAPCLWRSSTSAGVLPNMSWQWDHSVPCQPGRKTLVGQSGSCEVIPVREYTLYSGIITIVKPLWS